MLVAVYGSLKKDFGNHGVMQMANGKFVANAITTESDFIMNGYGFPYIVRDNSDNAGSVSVELYEVDSSGLKHELDSLEGHPTFYKREVTTFYLEDGSIAEAWIYIYQGDITANTKLLEDGNVYTWKEN